MVIMSKRKTLWILLGVVPLLVWIAWANGLFMGFLGRIAMEQHRQCRSQPATPPVSETATNDTKPPAKKSDGIKPYAELIPADARTQTGVFRCHRVEDKWYFEIPANEFGNEFLWVARIERTQAGYSQGGTGVGNRVVRWVLSDKTVLLREVRYSIRATGDPSARHAVEASSFEPILRRMPVAAWGTNGAAVIEVTDLFLNEIPDFSAKETLRATDLDRGRSFIETIKTFPENIETRAVMTYTLKPGAPPQNPAGLSAVSVLLHHSMVRLPREPMLPRIWDARVGFFTEQFEDYGSGEHKADQTRYLTRWRLEKRNPDTEYSEPRKPIVLYIDHSVPDRWRPWVRKGIEAWEPAFRAAGFVNAIMAKDPPSDTDDPEWSPDDARYSSILWQPSTIENAYGPQIHDPRSGEILDADIVLYHNILKLVRDWYFVQVSPLDERARKLPLPDDLMGELLAMVVTHEVGHSLGFPHNMKASSAYTVEQLRDPEFTRLHGCEASIMDYGRFNYVAQPGDGARLIPIIGPYDLFAVEWGYRQFPGITNAADEKKLLEAITARQKTNTWLRFGDLDPVDPTQQREDLGSDPLASTDLGLRNLSRVAGNLVAATCRPNEDYDELRNMFERLIRQRDFELGHVAPLVGGVVQTNLWYGDAAARFTAVDPARQKAALAFLLAHAFEVDPSLVDTNILLRIEPAGAADRILASQRTLLGTLIEDARIKRLSEIASRQPGSCYLPADFLRDLRAGLWREISTSPASISLYRRNLQRAHAELLIASMARTDASSDLPALARAELRDLLEQLKPVLGHPADAVTEAHLRAIADLIGQALDPGTRH